MKFTRPAAIAAVAALLLAGGIAYASIPAPDGTINGCRKNTDGSLRVIDSTATCASGWTALNWSQTGPAGPTGAAGVSGYESVSNSEGVAIGSTPVDLAVEVFCSTGKKAFGGGGVAPSDGDASVVWVITRSQPITDGTAMVGWRVQAHRFGPVPTTTGNLTGYVICATAN